MDREEQTMNTDYEFEMEEFDLPAEFENDKELSRFRRLPPRSLSPRPIAPRANAPRPRPVPPRKPKYPRPIIGRRTYLYAPDSPAASEYVRWVQTMLNQSLNLQLPVDGIVSVETRSAIRSFQEKNGLPVTGIVGPDSERALISAGRAGASVAPADQASSQLPNQAPDQETAEWDFETPFSFSIFPKSVLDAVRRGLESIAIQLAVASGSRDENALTDLIFFARHRERSGKLLKKGEPDFAKLSLEWLSDIRDRLVRPALFKAFFKEYDRRTFPGPQIGIADNPNMSLTEKATRLSDVLAMKDEILTRRDLRATEALKGNVPPAASVSSSLRPVAERLSKVQLDLFREFFSDGKGAIRFDVFQSAFEQFANGELRNPALSPKDPATGDVISAVGEPDGGFFFLFAEFAFLCIDSGIDRAEWSAALKTFVKSQEIFMHIYRPDQKTSTPSGSTPLPKPGPKLRSLDDFSSQNFNSAARSDEKRKERLRSLYDGLGVESLRQSARNNLLRAQRMP
jgi:hypothetical protein